jgi:hypothetical protein
VRVDRIRRIDDDLRERHGRGARPE